MPCGVPTCGHRTVVPERRRDHSTIGEPSPNTGSCEPSGEPGEGGATRAGTGGGSRAPAAGEGAPSRGPRAIRAAPGRAAARGTTPAPSSPQSPQRLSTRRRAGETPRASQRLRWITISQVARCSSGSSLTLAATSSSHLTDRRASPAPAPGGCRERPRPRAVWPLPCWRASCKRDAISLLGSAKPNATGPGAPRGVPETSTRSEQTGPTRS
mmetsp:Transcript_44259/g.138754  ORF Transcript_44259/g.138754 Transcript_44259/m.138754 type:complete len:212 (+) Transcript_44259:74-709(+)